MADLKTLFSIQIDASKAQEQLDATTKAISKVKDKQKELNEQLEAGIISQKDYNKENEKCVAQLQKLEEQQKKTKKAVDEENSVMGQMAKTSQMMGSTASGAFGKVSSAVGGLSNAFKALIANPIMAVIAGIVVVVKTLTDAIQNNEEHSNRLSLLMAKFEPIMNALKNALDLVVDGFLTLVEWIVKWYEWLGKAYLEVVKFVSKITGIAPLLKKVFGIDVEQGIDNFVENMGKASEATVQLQKDTIALEKRQREYGKNLSDINNKIADLQEDLADKESLSYDQRMAKTKELTELRKKAVQEELELAKEELRIAQAKAELAPNSKADNEALAKLTEKVANAQAKLNLENKKGAKMVKAELKAIDSEKKAKLKQAEDARKARLAEQQKLIEERNKFIEDVTKATTEDIFQQSLEGLDEYEKTVRQIEHNRERIVKEITDQIRKVEEYGNKELADKLRERLELNQKALDKQLENARKKREEENKRAEDEIIKRSVDFENKMIQAELKGKGGAERINAELEYNKRILEQKYQQDLKLQGLTDADRLALEKTYQLERIQLEKEADQKMMDYNKKLEDSRRKEQMQTLNVYQQSFGQLSSMFDNFSKVAQNDSKQQQALAKISMALQMALAMANGIKSAMELPFPANVISAGATMAELAVMFNQIRKQKDEKFSKGGLIGGSGSGTSDSNVQGGIAVSKGEAVINAKGTRLYGGLLSSINTSTGGEPIRTASNSNTFQNQLRSAIMSMPSPVVSVVDINKGQDRTNYVKTVSRPL